MTPVSRRIALVVALAATFSLPALALAAPGDTIDTATLELSSVGNDLNIEVRLADAEAIITSVLVSIESKAGPVTIPEVESALELAGTSDSLFSSNYQWSTVKPILSLPANDYVVHVAFVSQLGGTNFPDAISQAATIIPETPMEYGGSIQPIYETPPDEGTSGKEVVVTLPPALEFMPDTAMAASATKPPAILMVAVGIFSFGCGALLVASIPRRRR